MTPNEWLKKLGVKRTLLAVITYLKDGVKQAHLSTAAFTSLPTDSPANTAFDDLVLETPRFSRRMGIFTGKTTASRSNISVFAHDVLSDLAAGNIYKQEVNYYLGDEDWPFADFIHIGKQLAERINPTTDTYDIEIRDPSLKLDAKIDTGTFTSGPNQDKAQPLCIGDVFNIEPVLEDAATHRYRVNFIAVEDVYAVRDNGVPVSYTKDNANGRFTLNQSPAGRITCDVKGCKPTTWLRYPSEVLSWLLTTFVGEQAGNIADLSALPNYTIGKYEREPKKLRSIIDHICESINGYHYYSRVGVFNAGVMPVISGTSVSELDFDDVANEGVKPRKVIEPSSKVVVNYRHNYTIQNDGLAGIVSTSNRDLYGKAYQPAESTNNLPDYPDAEPKTIDSCLAYQADAQAVSNQIAAQSNQRRYVYQVEAFATPFLFDLADEIKLTYWDFGLINGKNGIVVGLDDNPIDGEVTVDLWM